MFDSGIVFRKDRAYEVTELSRGRGIFIAALETYQSRIIATPTDKTYEDFWIHLTLDSLQLILGVVYLAPDANLNCYTSICNTCADLRNTFTNKTLVDDTLVPKQLNTPSTEVLLNTLLYFELLLTNKLC